MNITGLAQVKNYSKESLIWHEGTLRLKSGEVITGKMNYNFVSDIVSVRKDGATQIYIPEKVSDFVFQIGDEKVEYYSIDYKRKDYSGEQATNIFEKIYQNNHYLVLSSHYLESDKLKDKKIPLVHTIMDQEKKNEREQQLNMIGGKEKVFQGIFLMDLNGNFEAILEKKKDRTFSKMAHNAYEWEPTEFEDNSATNKQVSKFKLIDSIALRQFLGIDYYAFEKYAKSKKLNIKTLDGLIQALGFKDDQ